jgi:hypothetical protein
MSNLHGKIPQFDETVAVPGSGFDMSGKSWITQRVSGVTTVLGKFADVATDAAWAAAAVTFFVVYPLALCISEERLITSL